MTEPEQREKPDACHDWWVRCVENGTSTGEAFTGSNDEVTEFARDLTKRGLCDVWVYRRVARLETTVVWE